MIDASQLDHCAVLTVVNSGEVIATDLGTRLLLRQNNSEYEFEMV